MRPTVRAVSLAALTLTALTLAEPVGAAPPGDAEALKKRLKAQASDFDEELDASLALRFFDAVKGTPLVGARVALDGAQATTDAEGHVSFPFPEVRPDEDVRWVTVEKEGYIPTKLPLKFMVGTLFHNRFSISPILPLGHVRIVLDWSDAPPDLDAHLVKQGTYHISFRHMARWEDKALLDRDDLDGAGPETITVRELDRRGVYTYYVHDYTHRTDPNFTNFSKSRAHVSVYGDGKLLEQAYVSSGPGLAWKVLEIRDGQVKLTNEMLADVPAR